MWTAPTRFEIVGMAEDESFAPPETDVGWTFSGVGHGILDVAGLVPLWGEAADVANAAWYAGEGNYLDAGLSLISCVPVVGDAIGKGGKVIKKVGVEAAEGTAVGRKALKALKELDVAKELAPFKNNPKLAPYIDKIEKALTDWLDGMFPCRKANRVPTTSTVRAADGSLVKAERIVQGTNGKVAIVGRTMDHVRAYADELRKSGVEVEIFDGPVISGTAKAQWDILTNGGKIRLSPEEAMSTQMFIENEAWAKKLVKEGFTVSDIGDKSGGYFSVFYAIEKKVLFGN